MKIFKLIKENLLIIILIFISAFLRIYHLDIQSPWLDEVLTLRETSPDMPFQEFKDQILLREGMPHFYFFIIRILNGLFIYTAYTARLFSAIIGVLSVYSIYKLGKTIYNKNVGLIASLLLTVNWFAISYSQEARCYMLLLFFTIISFTRLIIYIKETNIKNSILFGLVTGLVINTHLIGLITIFSQYALLLFIFLYTKKNKKIYVFKCGIISFFTALMISLPTYEMFLKATKYKSGWLQLPNSDGLSEIFRLFLGNTELLYFIFTTLIVYYFIRLFNQKQTLINLENLINNKLIFSSLILLTWFFLPILIPILKSYTSEPMILHRYFIGLLPALIIAIAIGIDLIKSSLIKFSLVIIIFSLSLTDIFFIKNYFNKINKSQYREITNSIKIRDQNKDKVVSRFGWLMSYFFKKEDGYKTTIEMNLSDYISSIRNQVTNLESFWYVDGNFSEYKLNDIDENFLNDNFILKESISKYDTWTRHYISKKK